MDTSNLQDRDYAGRFPPIKVAVQAARKATRMNEERQSPFKTGTEPYAHLSVINYEARLQSWLDKVPREKEPPNSEQMIVLRKVRDRLVLEFALNKEDADVPPHIHETCYGENAAEPLRGLIHGLPGTGKSRVLKWITRMFIEALGWEHGKEFICVAFQNRMAAAIQGTTLHTAANLPRPGQDEDRSLTHSDVDHLFTQNQCLRWILIDEISMVADVLLGQFESYVSAAATTNNKYRKRNTRDDKCTRDRVMGGYNLLVFGDWNQLPPIPGSHALFQPPTTSKTEMQRTALNLFWGNNPDSLNFLMELTIQSRIDDNWYNSVVNECRNGALSTESYYFLMGLPTRHAGSWCSDGKGKEWLACGNKKCESFPQKCAELIKKGRSFIEMRGEECSSCQEERDRRNRLITEDDPRITQQPFLEAPYVNKNNQPKYHAALLRAVEIAKRGSATPEQILWFRAEDRPNNPAELACTDVQLEKKLSRFLQRHEQETAGIPGLFPMYWNLRMRTTERLTKHRAITILKHAPGRIVGWVLHGDDRIDSSEPQRLLKHLPLCIFVRFEGAEWQIDGLPVGVFPIEPVEREWVINKQTKAKAKRRGFPLIPDYGSTSHLVQGESLEAEIGDCGDALDNTSQQDSLSSYVMLSRVRRANGLLLLRAFSPNLFRRGPPPGPYCLMKLLRARLGQNGSEPYGLEEACEEYERLTAEKKVENEKRRDIGVQWECFDCQREFPAAAYGVNGHRTQEEYDYCLAPGHWRRCEACTMAHNILETSNSVQNVCVCDTCGKNKLAAYFREDQDTCRSCELAATFHREQCKRCHKVKYAKDFPWGCGSEHAICFTCEPESDTMKCDICKTEKHIQSFPHSRRFYNRTVTKRCKDCFKCATCLKSFTDARKMEPWSKICNECKSHKQEYICSVDVCQRKLKREQFDRHVFENAIKHKRNLVCLSCAEKGYSPKDVKSYTCQRVSGNHQLGHLKFDRMDIQRAQVLLCSSCKQDEALGKIVQSKGTKRKAQADNDLQCKMCEIAKPRAAYAQNRLKNYHKQTGELR